MSENSKVKSIVKTIEDHLNASKNGTKKTVVIFPDFLQALANAVNKGKWKDFTLNQVFNDKVVEVFKEHINQISQNNEESLAKDILEFRKKTLSQFIESCAKEIKKSKIDLKNCDDKGKEKIAQILKTQYTNYTDFKGTLWQKYISPYWKNFVKAFTKEVKDTTEKLIEAANRSE